MRRRQKEPREPLMKIGVSINCSLPLVQRLSRARLPTCDDARHWNTQSNPKALDSQHPPTFLVPERSREGGVGGRCKRLAKTTNCAIERETKDQTREYYVNFDCGLATNRLMYQADAAVVEAAVAWLPFRAAVAACKNRAAAWAACCPCPEAYLFRTRPEVLAPQLVVEA